MYYVQTRSFKPFQHELFSRAGCYNLFHLVAKWILLSCVTVGDDNFISQHDSGVSFSLFDNSVDFSQCTSEGQYSFITARQLCLSASTR